MVKRSAGRPAGIYILQRMRPSHLEEIAGWVGIGSPNEDADSDDIHQRLYLEFRRHYRPLWDNGSVRSYVMTKNGRPIFCMSLMGMGHLYLLCSPQIYSRARTLRLAWQAATVCAFLRLGLSRVQTAVNADHQQENEALLILGYKLEETISETAGRMNVYRCERKDLRVIM